MGKVGRAIQMQLSRHLKNVDSKHEEMLERLSPSNPFLNVFEAGKPFSGPFIIMPVTLDHSAFEAFAFKIEVEGHSTFHTGDFRTHGFRSKKFPELISKFVGTVDCVVCEATNVLRHDAAVVSERDLQCQFEDAFKESFEAQGWSIVESRILNLNGMPVYNIITSADEGGRTLENNTSALINDGNMYVFELMHFKEFPYAYNDYLAIMDSVEFE